MVKIITICAITLILSGCFGKEEVRVVTEYEEVLTPVAVVPEPPKVERPNIEINKLSDEDIENNTGKSVQYSFISLLQTMSYSEILEMIIEKYRELSTLNPNIDELSNQEAQPRSATQSNESNFKSSAFYKQYRREQIIEELEQLGNEAERRKKLEYVPES